MDKSVVNSALRVGYFRVGVRNDQWEIMRKQWGDCEVTRYRLQLDSPPNATTGHYTKTYVQESATTVGTERLGPNMIIYDRAMQSQALAVGTYVKDDAVGVSADPFLEGDGVLTKQGQFYEVKTVKPHYGPDNDFYYYIYDLTLLPFKYVSGSSGSATVQDARYRTKTYLDTYINSSAVGNFLVCYANPDYSLVRVFKEKGKDVIFALGEPSSQPLLGATHYAYGYNEKVPITIQTIDKEDVSGTQLKWNAEAELRRILETYPLGSLRSMERRRETDVNLGSTKIYGTEFVLDYTRGTT